MPSWILQRDPFELQLWGIQTKSIILLLNMVETYYVFSAMKFESKFKWGALARLRFETNFSLKLVCNLFCYDKAQANSFGIYSLRVLDESEQFKQFTLVLNLNAAPCVFYLNLKKLALKFYFDKNMTRACEFDGVALKAQEYLHKPLFVRYDVI